MRHHRLVPTLASCAALGLLVVPAGAAGAADGGVPITVQLTGAAERPGPGDPDGTGTASLRLNPGQEQICYTLQVSGIAPATGAHIHVGGADVAGPVVVPLAAPSSGTSSGCADVDRELVLMIIHDRADYYVNVHTPDYPAGALRGQLG